jgi:uncharacterized protein (TIGR02145 family)
MEIKLIKLFFIFLFFGLTSCDNSKVKDEDGNVYKTVKIGNQIWMAENLNVEHYQNGDPIPQVQNINEWNSIGKGAWCYYDNNPENGEEYGKLYNWYAVSDPRGLAPEGWHIPTSDEFEQLYATINNDSNSLIDNGQKNGATNASGFSALFGGSRGQYDFRGLGKKFVFWSSTEAVESWSYFATLDHKGNLTTIRYHQEDGCSVRFLKDENKTDSENARENSKNKIQDTKVTYSCSQYDAQQAANNYLKTRNINPNEGHMDYYPSLSDPQNCYFVFYGAYSIGSGFNSSIENIYIHARYVNGDWNVNIEY